MDLSESCRLVRRRCGFGLHEDADEDEVYGSESDAESESGSKDERSRSSE
jgi:hypothetical protein